MMARAFQSEIELHQRLRDGLMAQVSREQNWEERGRILDAADCQQRLLLSYLVRREQIEKGKANV